MEKEYLVKVHESYRNVIALCDKNLKGKFLDEGNIHLDLSTAFFDGEAVTRSELEGYIHDGELEDATFYIVGKKSTEFALKHGLINADGIIRIEGVPVALVLL